MPVLRRHRARLLLAGSAAVLLIAVLVNTLEGGGPAPPPLPSPRPVTENFFGTQVTDPYRYFEDMHDPVVVSFFKDQNAYARSVLGASGRVFSASRWSRGQRPKARGGRRTRAQPRSVSTSADAARVTRLRCPISQLRTCPLQSSA